MQNVSFQALGLENGMHVWDYSKKDANPAIPSASHKGDQVARVLPAVSTQAVSLLSSGNYINEVIAQAPKYGKVVIHHIDKNDRDKSRVKTHAQLDDNVAIKYVGKHGEAPVLYVQNRTDLKTFRSKEELEQEARKALRLAKKISWNGSYIDPESVTDITNPYEITEQKLHTIPYEWLQNYDAVVHVLGSGCLATSVYDAIKQGKKNKLAMPKQIMVAPQGHVIDPNKTNVPNFLAHYAQTTKSNKQIERILDEWDETQQQLVAVSGEQITEGFTKALTLFERKKEKLVYKSGITHTGEQEQRKLSATATSTIGFAPIEGSIDGKVTITTQQSPTSMQTVSTTYSPEKVLVITTGRARTLPEVADDWNTYNNAA